MYDEDFDDDEPNGSELLKQLRKQLKEAQKELGGLREENEKLQVGVRQRTLAEALPKGVKPGIVKWAVKDGVTTPDELTAWLEENGEFFGVQAEASTGEPAVSEDDLRQMQAVQQQTATGGLTLDRDDPRLKIGDGATSLAELANAFRAAQQTP